MMPIDSIPDWEQRIARQDAFWARAILDRPVVCMQTPKAHPSCPELEPRAYASLRDRWMDTERVVDAAVAAAMKTDFLGDALPVAWPNLGPEVFGAFFGQDLEFTEETSWSKPIIEDWARVEHVRFSEDNVYWKKLLEMTDALLDAAAGRFYVGISDIHPGGDALAAFRDPMALNTDLLLTPEPVKALLDHVNKVYFDVYDFYYRKLVAAGQAISSWPGIVSSKKWYVPSNDFSCMISKAMFDEFFLPGLVQECRHLEASIYHLDGPAALRHLDSLVGIPELNAIQWVYGAGNGRASDWIPVYQRCQQAGKGIQLFLEPDEVPVMMEHLRPEGVWMSVSVSDRREADEVLQRVALWR
jgi:hypothetical protein